MEVQTMELQLLELVLGILTLEATFFLIGYRIGFAIGKADKKTDRWYFPKFSGLSD